MCSIPCPHTSSINTKLESSTTSVVYQVDFQVYLNHAFLTTAKPLNFYRLTTRLLTIIYFLALYMV
jgi:hypothetical protein